MKINDYLLSMWQGGRNASAVLLLNRVKTEELTKRMKPETGGIGFLLGHIAEVEILYCGFFLDRQVNFAPKAVGGKIQDTGQYLDLDEIKAVFARAEQEVTAAITELAEDRWAEIVENFLGTYTRASALGRLINHTGYHAGQAWQAYKRA